MQAVVPTLIDYFWTGIKYEKRNETLSQDLAGK